jgi:hypothetical protein
MVGCLLYNLIESLMLLLLLLLLVMFSALQVHSG